MAALAPDELEPLEPLDDDDIAAITAGQLRLLVSTVRKLGRRVVELDERLTALEPEPRPPTFTCQDCDTTYTSAAAFAVCCRDDERRTR